MRVPAALTSALRACGVEVRRKPPVLVRSPHELGMSVEFVAAHHAARTPGPWTLLQVGAYDGETNDPVVHLLRGGWRGVLVEPQPDAAARLRRLHAERPHVQVFEVALDARDGTRPLWSIAGDGPDWLPQLASFSREHLTKHLPYSPAASIRCSTVETWTFDTLLARAGDPHVDLLQLDAEGWDWELLQRFDVPRRRPAIVNFEHQHLSRADRAAAVGLLVDHGYRVAQSPATGDTVAYRCG